MGIIHEEAHYALAIALVAFLIRAFVLGHWNTIKRNGERLKIPPNTLPLVGNGLQFLQSRWKLFSWFDACQRKFGYETVALSVPTLPPGVLIHDPRNLDYVFKNEGVFTKGNFVKGRTWDLFGNGIINAEGDFWKTQRKAGLSFLNTANLRVLTDVALPQYLSESIAQLRSSANGTVVVDLQHVFHEITTKLMGKMAYNMKMHADDEFTVSFDHASGGTAERFQNPLWFVTEIFLGTKLRKSIAVVKDFGRRIVTEAVQDRQSQNSHEKGFGEEEKKLDQISGSLIQSLLDAIQDEQMVADAALTYLSAGRDTTGQALTWTFYLLMRHPRVVSKIRKEAAQLLKEKDVALARDQFDSSLFNPVTMPYSMAVFYEVLRIYPPIPFEIRQCNEDVTLPDGTFLPESSILVWCLWAMQRSKLTWGEDADEFKPERFLDENNKLISRSPSEFPVFYGGPRTCLGRKMAEAIAAQVIPTMACLFDFVPTSNEERTSKTSLTLPMEGGLPVTVKTRAGEER
ncbi:cytochrome P450 [Pseudoneurospora amorphoporcata]|uniref:Cytochrome P450 n=1 Tax=Pseudoneurospora amorphoporcata TaxID=241081 RepID=A0AAN6SET3_9PEZI|nr:cytochrome P450 [Pseudoneurospora amorphoporcata]